MEFIANQISKHPEVLSKSQMSASKKNREQGTTNEKNEYYECELKKTDVKKPDIRHTKFSHGK